VFPFGFFATQPFSLALPTVVSQVMYNFFVVFYVAPSILRKLQIQRK
jgi:hypothetical protein